MAYIKSKDIQLFPSAFRGQYISGEEGTVFNPGSRLTTEYNLTTLSARASRFHQSYVLDYKRDTDDKTIIFNIKGYLFEIKMASYLLVSPFSSATSIWAKIKLENLASDDINNTVDTNPVLRPVEGNGTILDELDEGPVGGNFLGLSLEITEPTGEYKLLILEKTGDVWDVPTASYFRMRANEISDATTTNKSINEKFKTEDLTVTKINKITITPPSNTSTLTIEDGKTLTVKDNVTLAGTGTATFNKNLTVAGPHNITLETDNANRTLKVSGKDKELAGAGSVLTMRGNLTTGAHTTTFITTNDTEVTLPTSGTLYGTKSNSISSSALAESVSDETGSGSLVFATSPNLTTPRLGVATATSINGLKIDTTTGTLDIANSKKLAVNDNITVGTNAITLASKSLTLTGSPSLSGITTTGTGTLALNKNLTVAADVSINAPLTITAGSTVSIDADVGIQGPVYVSDDGVSLLSDVTVNSALQVGEKYTNPNTGKVIIRSAGQKQTTITGPNDGEAKLIAGTYGSLATTDTTPPESAMRMLISTGPNSAVWAVDVLKVGFNTNGTSYHTTIDISVLHSTPINGFYRKKYSDSAFYFKRLFRDTSLSDLSKCFAVTDLTFDVPYSTSTDAESGTTKIVVPFTLGTASSAQTTNYTAVANDSGSTPGVASKIEISADGICTIYVAVVKTDMLSSFRTSDLYFTGSVIQIDE